MKTNIRCIVNFIEMFRQRRNSKVQSMNIESDCGQNEHYDFYCDTEKPFISS